MIEELLANQLLYDSRTLVIGNEFGLKRPGFVRLGEDFLKQISYNRRKLFPVFTKAKNTMDKKLVTLKADSLIINGKKYTVDTLDRLKGELSMKHFCERSNDNVLVMGGIYSNFHPLSNYYPCNFVFRNQKYSN